MPAARYHKLRTSQCLCVSVCDGALLRGRGARLSQRRPVGYRLGMANSAGPGPDLTPRSSSGYSSQLSLPLPTEPCLHCVHDNTTYSEFSSTSQQFIKEYTVNSAFDEAKPAWVYAWVESTKDSTKSLGTSPSSASVDHSQLEVLPQSASVPALSEWTIFVPLHHPLRDSGRFRRTLRIRRCRRSCEPNRPMVTSCSVAEDNLSLSVVLSLLCLFLNPLCLLLTLPAALLAYMAECSEREGDLTGSYKKLNVVAALNFIVFFGGFFLPLGGVVTVIVMKYVK